MPAGDDSVAGVPRDPWAASSFPCCGCPRNTEYSSSTAMRCTVTVFRISWGTKVTVLYSSTVLYYHTVLNMTYCIFKTLFCTVLYDTAHVQLSAEALLWVPLCVPRQKGTVVCVPHSHAPARPSFAFGTLMPFITAGDQSLAEHDFNLLPQGCWYNDRCGQPTPIRPGQLGQGWTFGWTCMFTLRLGQSQCAFHTFKWHWRLCLPFPCHGRSMMILICGSIMSFFIEHLKLSEPTLQEPSRVLLVPPNLTFFLGAEGVSWEDLEAQMAPLSLEKRDIVILAVNSASACPTAVSYAAPLGSHWSVLLFDRSSSKFVSFDSLQSSPNMRATAVIANRLLRFLQPSTNSHTNPEVVAHPGVPVQNNSADCGPYACAFIEQIVRASIEQPDGMPLSEIPLDFSACEAFRDKLERIVAEYGDNQWGTISGLQHLMLCASAIYNKSCWIAQSCHMETTQHCTVAIVCVCCKVYYVVWYRIAIVCSRWNGRICSQGPFNLEDCTVEISISPNLLGVTFESRKRPCPFNVEERSVFAVQSLHLSIAEETTTCRFSISWRDPQHLYLPARFYIT